MVASFPVIIRYRFGFFRVPPVWIMVSDAMG